jgi:prepilin-type N-terminal cleavage/methylation domain-containing protein
MRHHITQIKQTIQIGRRGDTIVEVLIAVAIIGVILVGAYHISNNSNIAVRDSQEHSQALKLAETQLETLNSKGGITSPDTCFDPSGTPVDGSAGRVCYYDSNNLNNCNAAFCFQVTITQPNLPADATYKIVVKWYSLNGGSNYVTLSYRVA